MALFLLLAAVPALSAGPAAALPSQPSCEVGFDTPSQVAHPTATLSQTLTFSGSINATLGSVSGSRTMAIAAGISATGWAASVFPASANITGTQRVSFNATVAVPAAELASTRGTLTVSASFQVFPGVPSSAVQCSNTATISVAQYYGVDGDTSTPRVTVTTGPTGQVATVIVRNLGNGKDTFTADLADRLLVEDEGIQANLPLRVTLEANSEANLTMTLNATSAAKEDTYDVRITVRSDTQPQATFDTFTITAVVRSGSLLPALPDFTTLIIGAAAAAAVVGAALLRRAAKRKRAAREARRQLQKVLKQRRELWGGDAAQAEPQTAAADEAPAAEAREAPAPPAPQEKVRVRVKARPGP